MNHPPWMLLNPAMREHLSPLFSWLDLDDPRGAAEQMDSHYPFGGFKSSPIPNVQKTSLRYALKYPGDPVLTPLAIARFRDEVVCVYRSDICAVWQKDGSFVCARFD